MKVSFVRQILRFAISAPLWGLSSVVANAFPQGPTELALQPHGAIPQAGWALARMNDGADLSRQAFVYPETQKAVRLYLIDTAVAHTDTWFSANPNFKSFSTRLIRGSNDPGTSSAFSHGTRLLSLICGPETGAALGTPIHVVNYDIYPNGEGSSSSSALLANALSEARLHHLSKKGSDAMPGVICIASGSTSQSDSTLLQNRIQAAVSAGLTVIVSAGNLGVDVASYLPAAYGIQDNGVICVGASSAGNGIWSGSNLGAAVDLYAPGDQVRVLNFSNPAPGSYGTMSGTSPAAALATAAALVELSKNPSLNPSQVEATLATVAYPAPLASAGLVQLQTNPESDSDHDGSSDLMESFFGSNPADPGNAPEPMSLTRIGNEVRLHFPIADSLFVSPSNQPANAPHSLSNGWTWQVRCSENLLDWQDASGSVTAGPSREGKRSITFLMPSSASSCFLRIDINPAP